ncbi:MAG TPA: polymer-forming cytoskeletal protein [Rhizomicrobium sp.]|nr:polymer-forming cytoskeletal protein [Rhizomicrobium sp.]
MFSSKSKDSAAPPPVSTASSPQPKRAAGRSSAPSIISADLVVNGTLTSSGDIQIDGRVEGDVHSAGLVIGEKAFIHGEVLADDVTVRGRVQGSVRARKVLLCSTCHVEGNILHEAFAVEAGAFFEGNCRHSDNPLSEDAGRRGTEYEHRAAPAPSVSAAPASAPAMTNGGGAMAARAMDVTQPRPAATVAPLKPGA